MKVKLKKAKIVDELFLEAEWTEDLPGHTKKDARLKCTIPIHEDLKAAFDALHVHLAILCDNPGIPKKPDFTTLEIPSYTAKSFTVGGNDENEGVTISGYKEGKYGLVNLNSPFTKYEGSDYPHIYELSEAVEKAIYEVEEYLFNGKRAPEKQLDLGFDETEQEPENEEAGVTE